MGLSRAHSVTGQGLGPVLVDDLDITWGLDPRLPIHLNWNTFVSEDGNLHCPTLSQRDRVTQLDTQTDRKKTSGQSDGQTYLCDAVVLQVDDSGNDHLHTTEHGYHLQDLIIEGRCGESLRQTGS